MSDSKREQKTIWYPKKWLDWAMQYYKENEKELNKLGVNSIDELVWRLAEMGKPELHDLIEYLKDRRKKD